MGGSAWLEGRSFSLRREGPQRLAQCLGLRGHAGDRALAVLRCGGIEALWDVSAAVLPQARDPPRPACGPLR
jgi:hypothetical protein